MEEKYSEFIMRNVRQNLGLEKDDTSRDDEVMEMSGYEILDRYLKWEGIIGYAGDILNVVSEAFPEATDAIDDNW